jgi:hypothetical protein
MRRQPNTVRSRIRRSAQSDHLIARVQNSSASAEVLTDRVLRAAGVPVLRILPDRGTTPRCRPRRATWTPTSRGTTPSVEAVREGTPSTTFQKWKALVEEKQIPYSVPDRTTPGRVYRQIGS